MGAALEERITVLQDDRKITLAICPTEGSHDHTEKSQQQTTEHFTNISYQEFLWPPDHPLR